MSTLNWTRKLSTFASSQLTYSIDDRTGIVTSQINEDDLADLLLAAGYELDLRSQPVHPDDCDHPSWTGVDQTPLDDPRKIWSCDVCQILQVGDGNGPTEEAAALRSAPVATVRAQDLDHTPGTRPCSLCLPDARHNAPSRRPCPEGHEFCEGNHRPIRQCHWHDTDRIRCQLNEGHDGDHDPRPF